MALYDSDFGEWQWQNSTASQVYMCTRPPGAVGEDADKPGRLEIHDLMERPKAGTPISPILASADGVERRHAVDMRLSPPTTLWIEPNDLRRNYALPQYAGRQLFRQRGDFGLGVRLSALRTELLYGISVGVLPAPATAERPTPRVAELQAFVGRVTEDATRTDEALSTRWELLRKAMERRPERLEIWTFDPARSNPFVPARFESGLTFALRSTALLSPPVISKNITPGTVTPPSVSPVRFHPAGLAGGALWPIESANVARVIAENPVGSGGVLDKIALSPTGDSGDQTVRFLGDYATVISETREGRLQRHRVEIMGRIGVKII